MKQLPKFFLPLFLVSLLIAALLAAFDKYGVVAVPGLIQAAARWFVIALLVYYALRKRSLTTWILISMVAGAEFGHDFPAVSVHLNLVSKIFLNLIKTIIAPLLFGTLVVGIAGHANLKQVGRMGWKSIVYFEVVSTIALFIGLLAIN
ncbi:MAG: cation:dicarboxylase symporter family transporter, partial [bacterium]